jgi:branched-chain amino acid transport system ATP-binding protein
MLLKMADTANDRQVEDLVKKFGNITAVDDISFEVEEGTIFGFLGPNGAGKTTFLRTLSRLVRGKGKILLENEDLIGLSPQEVIRKGVAHCPEGRMLFPYMSVRQNLLMGAFLREDKDEVKKDLGQVFSYLPVLGERQKQLAGTLSGGEQQMLAIGRAIMAAPRLLTLDEPSFGLAPLVIGSIFEVLHTLNKLGVTVLLVEQNAWLALEQTSFTYVLEEGHIIKQGPTADLLEDPSIREAYLGMT